MNKLTLLQKIGIVIGVVIGLGTVANTVGVIYVAGYRITATERSFIELRAIVENTSSKAEQHEYRLADNEKAVASNRAELKIMREQGSTDRELLVRIDERLRQVQAALKLPQSER